MLFTINVTHTCSENATPKELQAVKFSVCTMLCHLMKFCRIVQVRLLQGKMWNLSAKFLAWIWTYIDLL